MSAVRKMKKSVNKRVKKLRAMKKLKAQLYVRTLSVGESGKKLRNMTKKLFMHFF